MGTRIMHSIDIKLRVIEMKKQGYSNKYIQESLGIRNITQVKTWWSWYNKGETYRLNQPVGKQYVYGKGPEGATPEETLRLQNKLLTQQVTLLKKYIEKERKWYQK